MSAYTGLSVVIVTYDRRDELRQCLRSVLEQQPLPDEIIVFDNASSDGTEGMVTNEFPEVRYIRSSTNIGCPGGRNRAIAHAARSHVLCVDDDGTLREGAIEAVQEALAAYPEAAVVSGMVIDDFHSYGTQGMRPVFGFSGGIACLDRKAFIALGGYHEDGLRQGEEGELAYGIYDAGLPVIFQPSLRLDHHVQVSAERWKAVVSSSARQTILTGLKRIPLGILPLWLLVKQPAQLRNARAVGEPRAYFQGLVEGVRMVPAALQSRRASSYRAALAGTRFYRAPVNTPDRND